MARPVVEDGMPELRNGDGHAYGSARQMSVGSLRLPVAGITEFVDRSQGRGGNSMAHVHGSGGRRRAGMKNVAGRCGASYA